jgi:hypothetical protein
MTMKKLFLFISITSLCGIHLELKAEPWLSTRFAQNCSGCHAPQRINKKPMDRRCTLSCQGCHVNPNGGGLRNHYGKWNENRWLRSFKTHLLKNKKNFAPYPKQHYGKKEYNKLSKEKQSKIAKKGYDLVEQKSPMKEELYSMTYGNERVISKNDKHFMYFIPKDDPYRLMEESKVDGGADIRWLFNHSMPDADESRTNYFLMAADFSLRYRPIYRKINLVYESRFTGSPVDSELHDDKRSGLKGLYVMVDDLPYNIFIMSGYYRPLLGNFTPDHYSISQILQAQALTGTPSAYKLLFQATSIGTAPNVPYLNLHIIHKALSPSTFDMSGFALNTGLRFVTLGASLNISFWNTSSVKNEKEPDNKTDVMVFTAGGALSYKPIIAEYELSYISQDEEKETKSGINHAFNTYIKLWRENYLQTNFGYADTSQTLEDGSMLQLKTGIRSFILPGMDVSILYEYNAKKIGELDINYSAISTQFHGYF